MGHCCTAGKLLTCPIRIEIQLEIELVILQIFDGAQTKMDAVAAELHSHDGVVTKGELATLKRRAASIRDTTVARFAAYEIEAKECISKHSLQPAKSPTHTPTVTTGQASAKECTPKPPQNKPPAPAPTPTGTTSQALARWKAVNINVS